MSLTYVSRFAPQRRTIMKIIITAGELLDKDAWMEACKLLGLNEWGVNEGLISHDDEFTLTEHQARLLDLIQ